MSDPLIAIIDIQLIGSLNSPPVNWRLHFHDWSEKGLNSEDSD